MMHALPGLTECCMRHHVDAGKVTEAQRKGLEAAARGEARGPPSRQQLVRDPAYNIRIRFQDFIRQPVAFRAHCAAPCPGQVRLQLPRLPDLVFLR